MSKRNACLPSNSVVLKDDTMYMMQALIGALSVVPLDGIFPILFHLKVRCSRKALLSAAIRPVFIQAALWHCSSHICGILFPDHHGREELLLQSAHLGHQSCLLDTSKR